MASTAPLTLSELDASLEVLGAGLPDAPDSERSAQQAQLRELHQLLLRAAPMTVTAPLASLQTAAELAGRLRTDSADKLAPRPRTVFRLLRAGAPEAAWAVLADNATGQVDEPIRSSTSAGARRTAWRLPLLTRVEPPKVFADLPGFRDPRFDAADDCYDITDRVRMKHGIDEVSVTGATISLGGWATMDALPTSADDRVRLIAADGSAELVIDGRRTRRPDLAAGPGDAQSRRAWAGWSVSIDPSDERLMIGSWALALELEHGGVARRAALGEGTSDFARAATSSTTRVGSRLVSWDTGRRQWRLVVATT